MRISTTLLVALLVQLAQAFTVSVVIYSPPHCNHADGVLFAQVDGTYVGQLYYDWSTGDATPSTHGVLAGVTYSVTVTDDALEQATAQFTPAAEPFSKTLTMTPICPFGGPGPIFEAFGLPGALSLEVTMGMGPLNLPPGWSAEYLTGSNQYEEAWHIAPPTPWVPGASDWIPYTDATGCAGTMGYYVPPAFIYSPIQVLQIDPACTLGGGRLRLNVPDVNGPFQPAKQLFRSNGTPVYLNESLNLPTGRQWFYTNLQAGTYRFVQRFGPSASGHPFAGFLDPLFASQTCPDTLEIIIPTSGTPCGTLAGKVFVDSDENCSAGGAEARIPGMVMEIQPGNYYTITSNSGNYIINLPVGAGYTVIQQTALYDEHCTGGLAFSIFNGGVTTRDQADTSLTALDARIGLASGPARPGFQLQHAIDLTNLTATNTGNITVSLDLDPELAFVSATPAPTGIVGNMLTWAQPNLNGFSTRHIDVWSQVPPNAGLIGTVLQSTATLVTTTTDGNMANNTVTHGVVVTGSFDPNDKTAVTSSGASASLFFIDEDEWIDYTIRFQNTGTDTAFLVVVVDSLPDALDPATFQALAASHAYNLDIQGHGVLRFMFPNILLPDSNVNESRSHGFVSFRIRPRLPVSAGTVIENEADIYFDYNDPVITEPSVLVAEFSTGVKNDVTSDVRVFPNPNTGRITIISNDQRLLRVDLLGVDGRLLRTLSVQGEQLLMDVSDLATGHYLLRLFNEAGAMTTRPIVKW